MIDLKNITLVCVDCLNHDLAKKAILESQKNIAFGDVKYISDDPESKYKILKITSKHDYSIFMIKEIPKYIDTDYVLVVQFDGFVINPNLWNNDWLNYDYIGAPWWYQDRNIGNGGFSLRSKKFLEVASKIEIKDDFNGLEDDYLLRGNYDYLISKGIKIAPEEVACKFSFEANRKYTKFNNDTFGFHGYNIMRNNLKL